MINYIRTVLNPEWYHGHSQSAPFFEGWYFKCISADTRHRWAFIPGVFINRDTNKTHAFIQVLDGTTGRAWYHTYQSFEAQPSDFDVRIGYNRFRKHQIDLHIDDEIGTITGQLTFQNLNPWPVTLTSPGIMGWFGWLGFLECYHGVCSFDHSIEGTLTIYGETIDFTGGRGYIEKDWGKSFPTGYIWQQSNHFSTPGTSLTASIATIPNLGRTFPGFIVGLWHNQQLYRFTTYNNTKVERLALDDDHVDFILYNPDYELHLRSTRASGAPLRGPEREDMHKRVDETMNATIDIKLYKLSPMRKTLVLEDQGKHAALEIVGDLSLLLKS